MKREDRNKKVQAVFDRWNSYKGRGKWKSCRKLMPHQRQAIKDLLKQGYTVEDIKQAIDNYALILLHNEYKWTYAWKLYEFLTRGKKWDPKDKQFYRFVGDFRPEDFMKDWYRRQLANPPIQPQVRKLCDKVGKKMPELPKSKCAQRSDIDKLKLSGNSGS